MLTFPGAIAVITLPLTVAIDGFEDTNVTGKPELEMAERDNVAFVHIGDKGPNEIV